MARGGARSGAGRPQKEQSQAKDRQAARAARGLPSRAIDDGDWLTLPRDGRSGRVPAWPLTKPDKPTPMSRRELAVWKRLWKTPQAVGWDKVGIDHDQVALYVRYLVEAEAGEAKQGTRNLVRQYAEHLGLTAPGLRLLHWRIGQPAGSQVVPAAPPVADPIRPPAGQSSKDRFTLLVGEFGTG